MTFDHYSSEHPVHKHPNLSLIFLADGTVKGSVRMDNEFEYLKFRDGKIRLALFGISETRVAMKPSHKGGDRELEKLVSVLCWRSPPALEFGKYLFVIDDVITSGGHFKTFKTKFAERLSDKTLVGIFWAIAR